MSELTSEHLDDFTLLRYVAGDLSEAERRSAARHLSECNACTGVEREIVQLDRELRALSDSDVDALRSGAGKSTLRRGDPFRARPEIQEPVRRRGSARRIAEKAVAASERARPVSEGLLRAVRGGRVRAALAELSLEDASHRYGLLYALQSSGAMIAESPLGSLRFAEEALDVLRRAVFAPAAEHEAEAMVPRLVLRGQAHTLAGQACIWTRELERARVHLELAYRSFAGGGDEINLAGVELAESQRRSFAGKPVEGLLLAERAGATYESFGLKDLWAKTRVACGLALFELDRQEEAIGAYREALPFFERSGLWSNYVGTLNSLATSFARAGRLEEARREYARALRRLSRQEHRSWTAFIRHGLGDVLFGCARYREAAISLNRSAQLYNASGLPNRALIASLFEVESWARHGDLARARHRLGLFLTEVERQGVLDRSVVDEIASALRGDRLDLERVASLRAETTDLLERRTGSRPA